jgi:hypothetical protein
VTLFFRSFFESQYIEAFSLSSFWEKGSECFGDIVCVFT